MPAHFLQLKMWQTGLLPPESRGCIVKASCAMRLDTAGALMYRYVPLPLASPPCCSSCSAL